MPKVSIIVPVYNTEKYLDKCLRSLINQTLADIEIICINDGSTDKSYEMLKTWASVDKRIKLLTQENSKQGAARNRGLDIAQGEFITFVDSDDWVDLDFCERLYNAAKKYNVNIAASSMIREKKDKSKIHLSLNKEAVYQGASAIIKALDNHFETAGKLYKHVAIKDLRFAEGVLYEDGGYTIRAIDNCASAVTVPGAVYHYFSNPKSTIKQKLGIKNENDKIETSLDLIDYAQEHNIKTKEWCIYKENHTLWAIKHYINRKDYYICGIKVYSKTESYNREKIFLVFNTACFGDVLLCNSLCQNIKAVFPNSKVVFITDKNWADVAKYQKDVDEVIVYDKKGVHKGFTGMLKFLREFPYKKPFASFITYNNLRNYTISYLLKSKYTIMAKREKSSLSTQEKHNLLLQPLTNKKVKNYPIKYNIHADIKNIVEDKENYVVLCTTSKKIEKDMPTDTAIELMKKLDELGEKVVYVGVGQKAIEHSATLKAAECHFTDLTNKTTISELGAVLKQAKCLISVDTGTMHMGCAVGTPTIAVFYEQDTINNWAPKCNLYKAIVISGEQSAANIFGGMINLLNNKEI